MGRLLSVTSPATPSNKTVGYRYDRDGNRTKLLYPNSDAVTYAFDKANRLTTVTDWASRVTSYAYLPDGALDTQTNVNGTIGEHSYDYARRLTEVWNKPGASSTDAITRHQFTMDAVGNRIQVAETLAPLAPSSLQSPPSGLPTGHSGTAGTAPSGLPTGHTMTPSTAPTGLPNRPGPAATTQTLVYSYDALYRLTSASGGPAGSTSYTYDPVGNRLTRTRSSIATTYAYDRADRITSATTPSSGTSYTVNAVGNMTARGSDSLAYDQSNRLTSTTVGSTTATYTYDGVGKRASKTVSSTTTAYVYDSNRGLPVLLEDGTRRYVWGLGLAYEVEGSSALVYHVDGLGSVRAITDSTKAVVQSYEADEVGVPITAQGGSAQPFGFTGEQRDIENGLTYLRARYYDPQLGRFVSRDRDAGHVRASSTLNRYSYVVNNPISYVDPSGRRPSDRPATQGCGDSSGAADRDFDEAVSQLKDDGPYVPPPDVEIQACISASEVVEIIESVSGGSGDGGGALTRVGRWMSEEEYNAMVLTGRVQEGAGGVTYVAIAPDPDSFRNQARPGSRYVEFDVPTDSLRRGGRDEWRSIPGPNSDYAARERNLGRPTNTAMPTATNIVWVDTK